MPSVTKQVKVLSRRRKAALRAANATYGDVARLARVSWRMVKYWIDGERASARVEDAYNKLTAGVTNGRR
jgi:hypothetical protein